MSLKTGEAELETADGARIFYRVVGQGPPAVYSHPFQNPTMRVAEIVPFKNLLTFVLPHPRGMVRSSEARSADDLSMGRLVEDMDELRHSLGVEQWLVHGRSEGGFSGLLYATRYPQAVSGLVLYATAASYNYLVRQQGLFDPNHPGFALLNATLWRTLVDPTDANYSAHWSARARILMRARALAQNKPVPQPPQPWPTLEDLPRHFKSDDIPAGAARRFQRFMADIFSYDVRDALPTLTMPALIVAGRHDPYCTLDQAEELASLLPQAELVILDRAAHAVTLDAGPQVEAAVRDFLTRHELCASS